MVDSRMKRNGYLVDPVLDTEPGTCYVCGARTETCIHEIYFGTKNREMSKRKGAYIFCCPQCHRIVHEKPDNGRLDRQLKRDCQSVIIDRLNEEGHDGREIFYAWFRRWYD